VAKIELGDLLVTVEIELTEDSHLLAAITRGASEELGLQVGSKVYALFKSAALDDSAVSFEPASHHFRA
jgi:molybdopterin-binding protein